MASDGQGQDRVKAPYRWHHSLLVAIVTASLVLTMPGIAVTGARASPPPQPVEGPGGSAYAFDPVETSRSGNLPTGAWGFALEGTSDVERGQMPVVLFLHGFGATDPQTYRGWIAHLVRRGHIVIYPDYQSEGFLVFDQSTFVANTLVGLEQGLDKAGLAPETIHVVGHSLGAVIGAAYLRAGPLDDLPPGASLTLIAPGGCSTCGTMSGFGVPLPDDLAASEELLVNIVVGSDDTIVGDGDARAIWSRLADVPPDRKRLVEVRSDRYGQPGLVADHLFVQSDGFGSEVDALDWFGVWRPLDRLIGCAESGSLCAVALGTDPVALGMGEWSDGTPVAPMVVVDPVAGTRPASTNVLWTAVWDRGEVMVAGEGQAAVQCQPRPVTKQDARTDD